MPAPIEIVDRGRGPQLSTSRITVQDVVPYLQRKLTPEQILEIMPMLRLEELQVLETYIQENFAAILEQDRHIRERNAERKTPPEIEEISQQGQVKMAALREKFQEKKSQGDRNGDLFTR